MLPPLFQKAHPEGRDQPQATVDKREGNVLSHRIPPSPSSHCFPKEQHVGFILIISPTRVSHAPFWPEFASPHPAQAGLSPAPPSPLPVPSSASPKMNNRTPTPQVHHLLGPTPACSLPAAAEEAVAGGGLAFSAPFGAEKSQLLFVFQASKRHLAGHRTVNGLRSASCCVTTQAVLCARKWLLGP